MIAISIHKFIKVFIWDFYKPLTLAFSILFIVLRSAFAVDCCIYSFVPGEVCYQDTTNGPKILSTGFGEISFDNHDEFLDASMEATMEAKSHISIFLNQTFRLADPVRSLHGPNTIKRGEWKCLTKKPFRDETIRLEQVLVGAIKVCKCHKKGTGVFSSVAISPNSVSTARATLQKIHDGFIAFDNKNYAFAIRLWRPIAEKGIAEVQLRLGEMFETGKGVRQNFASAAKWYLAAAQNGMAAAQYKLWRAYFLGHGVPQDYAIGAKWLQNAAKQGYIEAEYRLGKSYHTGIGVPQNFDKAIKWYLSATRQGNAKAHYNLGVMFYKGEGVKRDPIQAYVHLSVAAKLGIGRAKRVLNQIKAKISDKQISIAELQWRQLMPARKQ